MEEPPQPAVADEAAQAQSEKPPLLVYGLAGDWMLLLLILLLQGILLRKKIHRLEEEKL